MPSMNESHLSFKISLTSNMPSHRRQLLQISSSFIFARIYSFCFIKALYCVTLSPFSKPYVSLLLRKLSAYEQFLRVQSMIAHYSEISRYLTFFFNSHFAPPSYGIFRSAYPFKEAFRIYTAPRNDFVNFVLRWSWN